MTASVIGGPKVWNGSRDQEGYRTYKVTLQVETNDPDDGPAIAMTAPGLYSVGSYYNIGNDADLWAFCSPEIDVQPVVQDGPNFIWLVTQTFTNKPQKRCNTTQIEDPLDEPDRIGGSFVKHTYEAVKDRNGEYIKTSSWEQLRGPQVERDGSRPTVWIEKNLSTLPLATYTQYIDAVNDSTLWGLPARTVKLSNVTWSRKTYGTCNYYYQVRYEFEINYNTFDKDVLDEGSKIVCPGGDPNKPSDFILNTDDYGNPVKVILDGSGSAWDPTGTAEPGKVHIEHYDETNFLLWDIPSSL